MYERFYRLRERPFALTPDPDYLYPSRVHQEALGYLRYGIETHAGFVVITGAIGSGKTTLLQTLLRGLDSQVTVARLMNTLLDPRELIEAMMIDVGLDPAGKSKPALLKEFADFLVEERLAGRLVLLVIDEAQNLALPALEEIRMLSNLETEKSKLLQIILVGQPELRDKLNRVELEQLRQRITVSYHLQSLDAEETARYVNHRLARASVGTPIEFPRAATDLVHQRSGGVPRLINVIADATLVFGYAEERSDIEAKLVEEVIADLDTTGVLGPRPVAEPTRPAPAAVAPVAASAAEMDSRELQIRQRELELANRERELIEQRRVLAEQYRILRSQTADAGVAGGARAASWPPLQARSVNETPAGPDHRARAEVRSSSGASLRHAPVDTPPFEVYRPKRRSLWHRVRRSILGGSKPVLEDSL